MLGWLKRKPAPIASEVERKSEDAGVSTAATATTVATGDERLERLLGRLGSETHAVAGPAVSPAVVLEAPRPEPAVPAQALRVTPPRSADRRAAEATEPTPPREAHPAPSADGHAAPATAAAAEEDPEEALLKELFPGEPVPTAVPVQPADSPEAQPAEAPAEQRPRAPMSARDAVAADKSAAEAAAVIADIERIVAGQEPETVPPTPTIAAPADEVSPHAEAEEVPPAEAMQPEALIVEPGPEAPVAQATVVPPPAEAAPSEAVTAEAPAADAIPPTQAPPIKIEMPAIDLAADALDDEATEEIAPLQQPSSLLARAEPKSVRRRGPRRAGEVEPAPAGGGDVRPPAEGRGGFAPMFVIAVASQKGGAGKTTLAAHLAVRAGIAGQGPVVLIDTDPQGSLAEWWHARSDETPALAVVRPEQLAANLAELRSYGTAIAVIDTPPALTGSIEQVIAMADLIIIPVRPSPHDLRAAGGTVEMAERAGKPFMFVVNGASPRASITAQAVAALSEHGRVAPVILYQRTEFAASMIDGRTVVEAAPSGRSAQEIAELWRCIHAQVGMRAAA